MRYSSSPLSPLLSNLLLLTVMLCQAAGAQTISDTTKRLNTRGDNGYWQTDQPDVMILWPGDDRNIVNRFTGSAEHPHPYQLWVDPDRGSGFPVVLTNEATFNNFLEHIKLNSDKDWCQIAGEWSAWSGNTPVTCGTHSYTQRRTCSIAPGAEKPCPDLCRPAVETRTRQVDNGPCQPPPPKKCSITDWSPARSTVCSGKSLTQRRTLADCGTDSQTVSGTKSCPQTCSTTAWSPDRNTACTGESLTQTRTLTDCSTDTRTVSGTRSCRPTCTSTSWSPSSSTVCSGESLTQTRTLADCSTDTRTVSGTRSCRPTCTATNWSPSTDSVCVGRTLTQTRTLADCSTDTRTVSGTQNCAPTSDIRTYRFCCSSNTLGHCTRRVCGGTAWMIPIGCHTVRVDCNQL